MTTTMSEPQIFRLTAHQYEKMCELDILPERGIELLDGQLFEMSAQGDRHLIAVRRLHSVFVLQANKRYAVDANGTVELGKRDMPDPDIVVSSEPESPHRANAGNIELIVEVANTSLKKDLGLKRERYALANIKEYWVVDLTADQVHIFQGPQTATGTYDIHDSVGADQRISPLRYPDVLIDIAYILGLQ